MTREEPYKPYNYSSGYPQNTTAGVLDSEYHPPSEYDMENDFDIISDSDEEVSESDGKDMNHVELWKALNAKYNTS